MSAIRPLEPGDIPAVASLYERVVRSGSREAPPALADFFRATLVDQPWADPDLPSLVYDDKDAGMIGFLGSHPRRLLFEGREVRLAVSGPMVADPDAGKPGVGALLDRTYMRGPQDLTITDGATPTARDIWQRLGGLTLPLSSLGWTSVIGPVGFAAALGERRGWVAPGRLTAAFDRLTRPLSRRALQPVVPDGDVEELTIPLLLELLERGKWAVRAAYDERFLSWLFSQMEKETPRGELRRIAVRDGDWLGWCVYYRCPDGISQVQQLAAFGDPGAVLDHVVADAAAGGSTAVQGRLEPALLPAITDRRCIIRRSEWALAHCGDPDLIAAITTRTPLLTRMEGEWWMGPHLIPSAREARA